MMNADALNQQPARLATVANSWS